MSAYYPQRERLAAHVATDDLGGDDRTTSAQAVIPFPTATSLSKQKQRTFPPKHRPAKYPSREARAAFDRYLVMDRPRSLDRLAAELYPNRKRSSARRSLEDWSAAYDWVRRAEEYDQEVKARLDQENIEWDRKNRKATDAMNTRQAEVAAKAQEQAITHINVLIARDAQELSEAMQQNRPIGPLHFEPKQLMDWFGKMAQLERTARGAANVVSASSYELTGKDGGPVELVDARKLLMDKIDAIVERTGGAVSGHDGTYTGQPVQRSAQLPFGDRIEHSNADDAREGRAAVTDAERARVLDVIRRRLGA